MNRLMTVFILCLTAMHVSAQWTDAMYNRYTWRNYTDYAPFNQSVQDSDIDADLLEAAIFYETNRQRVSHGLTELAANATYAAVARYVVEDLWMNSAGHRKNILSSRYTHLGCGVAFYYDNGVLMYKATQNFLLKDVN